MFFHKGYPVVCAAVALALLTGVTAQAETTPATTSTATVAVMPTDAVLAAVYSAPMTVDDAVKLALQLNETVKRAQLDISIAEYQISSAKSAALPSVNAQLLTGINDLGIDMRGRGVTFDQVANNLMIIASKPIWPPESWRAPRAAAEAGLGSSKETLNSTRQQLAYQVRLGCSQYFSAEQMLNVAKANVTVATEQLKLARSRVAAGTAAKIDEFQAEANLSSAEISLNTTTNNLSLARAALAVQIGLPASTYIQVIPEEKWPLLPANEEKLTQFALEHRPDVKSLAFTRDQIDAGIDQLEVQKRPTVALASTFSSTFASLGHAQNRFSIGFDVKYNVYNGGKLNATIDSTRLQREQLESSISQVKLGIGLQVRQAYLNLQSALEQQKTADKQVTAATESARIAKIRYDAGEGIYLEKQQADLNKLQADTALVNARYQAQIARAQLYQALGVIYPAEEGLGL